MPDEPLQFEDEPDEPRSTAAAVLAMLRPPNLPTAWADILLGYWMFQWAEPFGRLSVLASVLVASTCLYLAGMVWNDVFDVEEDRRERPDRPIPSGEVSLNFARVLAVVLTVGGLIAASFAGLAPLAAAGVLAAAILFYDAFAKRYPFGPAAMGLCRALNVVLGASPALYDSPPQLFGAMALVWTTFWWSFPLGNGLYIAGVTVLAKHEAKTSGRGRIGIAAAIVASGFVLHAWSLSRIHGLESAPWIVLGFAALTVGFRILRAAASPSPRAVQAAVGSAVVALIMIDAALLLAVQEDRMHAMIVVCLLPLSVFLARWYYST